MIAGTLNRSGNHPEALLSDQTYRDHTSDRQRQQSSPAQPITMDEASSFSIPFGRDGWLSFEQKPDDWFMPLLGQIHNLMLLPSNWDTYGARQIDPQIAFSAVMLLLELLSADYPAPSIVPTIRGGIQLEWHDGGIDLEIEFLSPSSVCLSFEENENEEEYDHAEFDVIQLKLNILRDRIQHDNGNR